MRHGALVFKHGWVNDDGVAGRVPLVVECGDACEERVEVKVRDFDFYWQLFDGGDEGGYFKCWFE